MTRKRSETIRENAHRAKARVGRRYVELNNKSQSASLYALTLAK